MSHFFDAGLMSFVAANCNLRHIEMDMCSMNAEQAELLASSLSCHSNKSSLKSVLVGACGLGHASGGVITALSQHSNILMINLRCNMIGFDGCTALRNLLENPLSQLKDLDISGSDGIVDDECMDALAKGLASNKKLKKLSLHSNETLTSTGWSSLETVLCSNSVLEELSLGYSHIDDVGAASIARGLVKNKTLKRLLLSRLEYVSSSGWQVFFRTLQSALASALEEIYLDDNKIDCLGMCILAGILQKFRSLSTIFLCNNQCIRSEGWTEFAYNLLHSKCGLKTLGLGCNDIWDRTFPLTNALKNIQTLKCLNLWNSRDMDRTDLSSLLTFLNNNEILESVSFQECNLDDEHLASIAHALSQAKSLKSLNLSEANGDITHVGWKRLATYLQHDSTLEELDLTGNSIDNVSVVTLANSLAGSTTLKTLNLDCNSISATGCKSISAILRNPNSALDTLSLGATNIDDNCLIYIAEALKGNSTLEKLDLSPMDSNSITQDGWNVLSHALNTGPNIESTFNSNHSLQDLGFVFDEDLLPSHLVASLDINMIADKSQAARLKIIKSFFLNGIMDEYDFIRMDSNIIHHAIAWLGRGSTGMQSYDRKVKSLLYKLVQGVLPVLHGGCPSR